MTNDLELFRACEGLEFRGRARPYLLSAGAYCTRHGALMIYRGDDGSPDCVLTRNLDDETMASLDGDEFFVRFEVKEGSEAPDALLDLGVFEQTDRTVSQGYSERYAVVWRFAYCSNSEHAGVGRAAVLCADCKLRWRERV